MPESSDDQGLPQQALDKQAIADASRPVSGDDIADPSPRYEQARDELAAVVAALEAGGLTLDESLQLWERGEQLARVCATFLEGARQRVESVLARADESPDDGRAQSPADS